MILLFLTKYLFISYIALFLILLLFNKEDKINIIFLSIIGVIIFLIHQIYNDFNVLNFLAFLFQLLLFLAPGVSFFLKKDKKNNKDLFIISLIMGLILIYNIQNNIYWG